MFESIVTVRANINAGPSSIVLKEINLMSGIKNLRWALLETTSKGIVDKHISKISTTKDTNSILKVS